jgi:hypothetical protein
MERMAGQTDLQLLPDAPWLRDARTTFDVADALVDALGPGWFVQREVDPYGDLSIIVAPHQECDDRPSFVFYEQDGQAQVSTFLAEEWKSRRAFQSSRSAVDAILIAATA